MWDGVTPGAHLLIHDPPRSCRDRSHTFAGSGGLPPTLVDTVAQLRLVRLHWDRVRLHEEGATGDDPEDSPALVDDAFRAAIDAHLHSLLHAGPGTPLRTAVQAYLRAAGDPDAATRLQRTSRLLGDSPQLAAWLRLHGVPSAAQLAVFGAGFNGGTGRATLLQIARALPDLSPAMHLLLASVVN